ncbi:MAG: sodium:calcium antiporter [Gammaproteobacteria bacterium]|nr:sodium:calcium antiporter [Gammaproteobacteria bacterium]
MTIVGLILGIVLICWGSDCLIKGVMDLGRRLHWPEFITGLIIVGFGTSVPEIAISIYSAISAHGNILVGNIVGSNITNASLVMGLALLIRPIAMINYFNLVNVGAFVIATLLLFCGMLLGSFPRWLGIIMIVAAIVSVWLLTKHYRHHSPEQEVGKIASWYSSVAKTLIGLLLLLVSSRIIVNSAIDLATSWHIDQAIIAMSIIAMGTSLPEIVLSVMASYRGYSDLVVGNIIGSNISNVLIGVGLPSIIAPFTSHDVSAIATGGLLLSALLFLAVIGMTILRKRWMGAMLIIVYGLIYGFIWWQ